jgi:hypothetical protein
MGERTALLLRWTSLGSMPCIAASILAARKLSQYDGGKMVPATVYAISDAVRWAEEILKEIDRKHPGKS